VTLPPDNSPPESGPAKEPPRLPQRWVIILMLAGAATIALTSAVGIGVGATVGVLAVGLLHNIMD
jgi:hypothetical protein